MTRLTFLLLAACGAAPAAPPIAHHASHEEPLQLTTFWSGKPQPRPTRSCSSDQMEAVMARPAESPDARAAAWGRLVETCTLAWSRDDQVGLRAHLDFGGALLGAGYPHDCVDVISPVATPYADGLRAHDGPLAPIQELYDDLLERCQAAHEAKLARFHACTGATCFALEPSDVERGGGDWHCAGVTFAGRHLQVEDGPLAGEFCCGIEELRTLQHGGTRFVRAKGAMFTRVCGGGTASATPDAVYKLAGDQLVLERDYTVMWH